MRCSTGLSLLHTALFVYGIEGMGYRVDLDIEGGSSTGFAAFVTQLRSHFASADKKYIVTAAPQCPFPDAYLGEVLNSVPVDAVYVQFCRSRPSDTLEG
jgi:hypothetical protein